MAAQIIPLRSDCETLRIIARLAQRQAENAPAGTPCPYGWAAGPLIRAAWREGQRRAMPRQREA